MTMTPDTMLTVTARLWALLLLNSSSLSVCPSLIFSLPNPLSLPPLFLWLGVLVVVCVLELVVARLKRVCAGTEAAVNCL